MLRRINNHKKEEFETMHCKRAALKYEGIQYEIEAITYDKSIKIGPSTFIRSFVAIWNNDLLSYHVVYIEPLSADSQETIFTEILTSPQKFLK